ncbi:MAG TPA: hypothetical protein VGV37_28115 [Aliidongia sp.]|uniref:hypothetical protein n=1 Tax=Aliidongia sp. TaxID=1914230 RepID=UPI002DDCFF9B|nr:hypothetical protein [Aliidongia sp.]HEV2678426.1 hypothetical protein [Aliidongia sp.]
MRWLAFSTISLLCCAGAPADGRTPAPAASVAAPTAASGSPLFDRLLGSWDVTYEIHDKDGKLRTYHGQVTYSWILDGAAMQEIWTSDSLDGTPNPYGTAIGFHDAKHQRWTLVWIYPAQGSTLVVNGDDAEGGYTLTGRDADGAIQRWAIDDVQTDTFTSRFESSADDGRTWRLLGVNHMQRHRA